MEKDIGKIEKNPDTDIVIRIDDFAGKIGLTIREFVNKSETGFTGFTKSGTKIPADKFAEFQKMISQIKPEDLKSDSAPSQESLPPKSTSEKESSKDDKSGIDDEGLM